MLPTPKKVHLRATYAALYAVATVIPEAGIGLEDLAGGLGAHIDRPTFDGLLQELERRRIIAISTRASRAFLHRGREYAEGLERVRLAGESLKGSA